MNQVDKDFLLGVIFAFGFTLFFITIFFMVGHWIDLRL